MKGAHRVYVSVPENLFTEMKQQDLLKDIDMLFTNMIIGEIMQRKEKQRNEQRRW